VGGAGVRLTRVSEMARVEVSSKYATSARLRCGGAKTAVSSRYGQVYST